MWIWGDDIIQAQVTLNDGGYTVSLFDECECVLGEQIERMNSFKRSGISSEVRLIISTLLKRVV